MSLKLVSLLLLATTTTLQACGGGGGGGGSDSVVSVDHDIYANKNDDVSYEIIHFEEEKSSELIDEWLFPDESKSGGGGVTAFRDPVKNNMWHHGWTPSPEEMKDWNQWFDDFNTVYNESVINVLDPNDMHKYDAERGAGSGWPLRWKDAGIGFPGGEPPPWAYAPKNVGKSRYCYLPPRIGVCKENQTAVDPGLRFAYNPYKDSCVPFAYSGCGGNKNQFHSKTICESQCVAIIPHNGCDPESQIYVDDNVAG